MLGIPGAARMYYVCALVVSFVVDQFQFRRGFAKLCVGKLYFLVAGYCTTRVYPYLTSPVPSRNQSSFAMLSSAVA
jgi:hypothetical protein